MTKRAALAASKMAAIRSAAWGGMSGAQVLHLCYAGPLSILSMARPHIGGVYWPAEHKIVTECAHLVIGSTPADRVHQLLVFLESSLRPTGVMALRAIMSFISFIRDQPGEVPARQCMVWEVARTQRIAGDHVKQFAPSQRGTSRTVFLCERAVTTFASWEFAIRAAGGGDWLDGGGTRR